MFSRALSRISLLLAILAAVLVTACGGGSGSPQVKLQLSLSESKMAYGPIVIQVYGGKPPYYFESNSSGIQVPAQSNSSTVYGVVYPFVEAGTGTISVWDNLHGGYAGRVTASFAIVATTISPSALTVTPTGNSGCTTGQSGSYAQICAGGAGIAELQLNGFNGPDVGKVARFNVLQGDYQIRADSAVPWGTTATTTTDSLGKAQVAIQTKVGSPTQVARIGVVADSSVGGSASINTPFVIVGADFKMVPSAAAWTTTEATCSSARTASFALFGGVPPYSVQTTLGTLSATSVSASGGTVVLTVAVCGNGSLTAIDAIGNTASATISYTASGTATPTTPDVVTTPSGGAAAWGSSTARVSCATNATFTFTVAGGTPPYTAFAVPAGANPAVTVSGAVGQAVFSAAPAIASSNFMIYAVDSVGKTSTTTPTIYCQ